MSGERGRDGAVVLGLVAPSGVPRELADQIAAELPGELRDRLGDVNWQVRVGDAERADMTPTTEALKQSVRRRMQEEGWDLAVGLTDLPLRANRRPVTAHASAMYRVGLLSVPALGARSAPQRAMRAVLNLVEGLLGEEVGRGLQEPALDGAKDFVGPPVARRHLQHRRHARHPARSSARARHSGIPDAGAEG